MAVEKQRERWVCEMLHKTYIQYITTRHRGVCNTTPPRVVSAKRRVFTLNSHHVLQTRPPKILHQANLIFVYSQVYSVIYDTGSVPRRVIFSPRETAAEVGNLTANQPFRRSLSSKHGTCKAVTARFLSWLHFKVLKTF